MTGLRRAEILPEERLPDAAEIVARGRALPAPALPPQESELIHKYSPLLQT